MKRRIVITVLLLILGLAPPAWAQGNGNGNGNGNSSEEASGNGNGSGQGNGNSGGDDEDEEPDEAEPGSVERSVAPGNGMTLPPGAQGQPPTITPGGAAPTTSAPGQLAVPMPEAEVLSAVQSGAAVPLDSLLPDLRSRTGGQVIDAQLVRVNGTLVYAIKVLTPQGRVGLEYYYAYSGSYIEQH